VVVVVVMLGDEGEEMKVRNLKRTFEYSVFEMPA